MGDHLTSHRPPVFIAATAATVLGALYFVPSASASQTHTVTHHASATVVRSSVETSAKKQELADTGAVDTNPYLLGGTAFLGLGAALVINAARRSRTAPHWTD